MTKETPSEVITKVVNRIKEERKTKELSHENMANDLKISTSAYNKIERQETKLTVDRLLQICSILDLSIAQVFGVKAGVIYNQEVSDSGIGNQGIENLYQDNRELTENYIESLKEQIIFLKTLIK